MGKGQKNQKVTIRRNWTKKWVTLRTCSYQEEQKKGTLLMVIWTRSRGLKSDWQFPEGESQNLERENAVRISFYHRHLYSQCCWFHWSSFHDSTRYKNNGRLTSKPITNMLLKVLRKQSMFIKAHEIVEWMPGFYKINLKMTRGKWKMMPVEGAGKRSWLGTPVISFSLFSRILGQFTNPWFLMWPWE